MSRLVNEIITKPDWEQKIDDEGIVSRWRSEFKAQGFNEAILDRILDLLKVYRKTKGNEYDEWDQYPWPLRLDMDMSIFTSDCSNCLCPYCDGENENYDSDDDDYDDYDNSEDYEAATENRRMQCSCESAKSVKKSNWLHFFLSIRKGRIDKKLCEALKEGARRLERGEPDWHPGSKQQMRDLVHPSLYCYVKGVTPVNLANEAGAEAGAETGTAGTETAGAEAETAKTVKEKGKEQDDEKEKDFIARPGKQEILTDTTVFKWLPADFTVHEESGSGESGERRVTFDTYINNLDPEIYPELYSSIGSVMARFIPMFRRVITACAYKDRIKSIKSIKSNRSIRGIRGMPWGSRSNFDWTQGQVIVKMANIELTPENPKYAGGSWHLEGLAEEEIVATGIYYYDMENISDSYLEFRSTTDHDAIEYGQGQFKYVDKHYPIIDDPGNKYGEEKSTSVYLDKVKTEEGMCLVFPNFLQHHVPSFRLEDKTRPGHRKILVFFLIHPWHRVLGTRHVAPQQGKMTLEEAKIYRELLMFQRKYKVDDQNNFFERSFSLCEH